MKSTQHWSQIWLTTNLQPNNKRWNCVNKPWLQLEITLGLISSCHCGVKKKIMPFAAPSSVTARKSNAIIMTYGNSAKKYEHLPELFTPREMIKNTQIHAPSRQSVRRRLGAPFENCKSQIMVIFSYTKEETKSLSKRYKHSPIPSEMSSFWFKTTFLEYIEEKTNKMNELHDSLKFDKLFAKTYKKYISELLATSAFDDVFKNVELSNDIESTQFGPHSGWHWAHGNCDENDAKK